jgi:hypothetical protein
MGITYAVYFGMAAISCLFAFFAQKNREKTFRVGKWSISQASAYLALAAVPLVLVSGLRWDTGIDHMNYYWVYTNIHFGLETHVEIGFRLLCKLLLLVTLDLSLLYFVCSLLTAAIMMAAIRRSSIDYFYSVFLYITMGFFFYSMNSIRHFLALAIFLFAFPYLKKRQFWRYLLCILIAASFQKFVLVAIPLYFLLPVKYKAYWYGIFSGGLLLVALFHRQLLDFVYQYAFSYYQNIESQYVSVSYVNILITLALSVMVTIYRKPLLERSGSNMIFINAAYLGLIFFVLCSWIPQYTRIGQHMTMLALFSIPEIVACEPRLKLRRFYQIGLLVGFTCFLAVILWNAQDPTIRLAPYHSVFSRESYKFDTFWFLPG